MTVSQAQLLRAISGSRVSIFSQDCDFRYRWVENSSGNVLSQRSVGLTDREIFPASAASAIMKCKSEVLASGKSHNFEQAVLLDGKTHVFEFCVHPEICDDGAITGLIGSVTDVSRERQQAQSLAKLILEVSHRSRNLLAVLQSIAAQSAKSELTVTGYRDRFVGRLQSLARAQDIITARDWQGAGVRELVEIQLEELTSSAKLDISCSEVLLLPSPALHVGLALHELATIHDDVKPMERRINVDFNQDRETMVAQLDWRDEWPESVDPMNDFSRSVLERAVPQAVEGEAELRTTDTMIHYRLQLGNSVFRALSF